MEKSNVVKFRKNLKEWKAPLVEQPKAQVNLISVDMATLLYNVIQSQRELVERVEEMADMIEHMEYQIDKITQQVSPTKSRDS